MNNMKKLFLLLLFFSYPFLNYTSNELNASTPPVITLNEVDGLKLPPNQKVDVNEGFITISADCKGTVKWLVLSTAVKVKYKIHPAVPNEVTIAITNSTNSENYSIFVYAIAQVDGKLTNFAKTEIAVIVSGNEPKPKPTPDPIPQPPNNISFPLHLSIIEDPIKRTPDIRAIIDSRELREKLLSKRVLTRVYSVNDPILSDLQFTQSIKQFGTPLIILQDKNGKGLIIQKLPLNIQEILKIISKFVGGF